jgi:hypothetical protein
VRVRALDRAGNASRLTASPFAVVGSWDAATDFRFAPQQENPGHDRYGNTTWFYLYSSARLHDPTLYKPLPEFHVIDANNQQWSLGVYPDGSVVIPLVGANPNQHLMVFHPDLDRFAVLGWRSPYTGPVSVSLQLQFPDPVAQARSNGIIWSIDREGTQLQGAMLKPDMQPANVTIPLDVTSGETLYLTIDSNGATESDTTIGQFSVQTAPR